MERVYVVFLFRQRTVDGARLKIKFISDRDDIAVGSVLAIDWMSVDSFIIGTDKVIAYWVRRGL